VKGQLGDKTNWSDSEDLSMMFQGAYTDEFYRALHDALHAQVDSWKLNSAHVTRENRDAGDSPDELWKQVVQLEKSCRNARSTVLPSFARPGLVHLLAGPGMTCGDD
jgi:hypothetical protein